MGATFSFNAAKKVREAPAPNSRVREVPSLEDTMRQARENLRQTAPVKDRAPKAHRAPKALRPRGETQDTPMQHEVRQFEQRTAMY